MRRFAAGGLSVEGTGGSRCSLVGELWGDVGQDGLCIQVFAQERLVNTASNHHRPSRPFPRFKVASPPHPARIHRWRMFCVPHWDRLFQTKDRVPRSVPTDSQGCTPEGAPWGTLDTQRVSFSRNHVPPVAQMAL